MPSRRFEYGEKVDPDAVAPLAARILDGMESGDEVWAAAAIHQHLAESVDYDHSVAAGFNRGPVETYEQGGNCVDLAILVSSVFRAVGLRCRLIVLEGDDSDHLTSAVAFPRPPRAVTEALTSYYATKGNLKERAYTWFEDQYFIADHGSRYVGDQEPLTEYTDNRGRYVVKNILET